MATIRSKVLLFFLAIISVTWGLYEDEAGQVDFLLSGATTSAITHASMDSSSLFTASSKGCFMSSRGLESGDLKWRRHVCSSTVPGKDHYRLYQEDPNAIVTVDGSGIVRGWSKGDGDLLWDMTLPESSSGPYRILGTENVVAVSFFRNDHREAIQFVNGATGTVRSIPNCNNDTITADEVVRKDCIARIIGLTNNENHISIVAVCVQEDGTADLNTARIMDITKDNNDDDDKEVRVAKPRSIQASSSKTAAAVSFSSIRLFHHLLIGITPDSKELILYQSKSSERVDVGTLHPKWNTISSIHLPGEDKNLDENNVQITIVGADDRYPIPRSTMALFSLFKDKGKIKIGPQLTQGGKEETSFDGVVACGKVMMGLEHDYKKGTDYSVSPTIIHAWKLNRDNNGMTRFEVEGVTSLNSSPVSNVHLLQCNENTMKLLATTLTGVTYMLSATLNNNNNSITVKQNWMAEEALGSITSALFLDESHPSINLENANQEDEEAIILRSLSFSSRLASQFQSVQSFVSGGFITRLKSILLRSNGDSKQKEYAFGFAKIAVLLSNPMHVILGADTASKGKIVWRFGMNPMAKWHKVVHGGPSGRGVTGHGLGGHHGGHEILALSYVEGKGGEAGDVLEWACLDGLRGRVLSHSSVSLPSAILQTVPIHGHSQPAGGCRQLVMLVNEDDTVTVIPNTEQARAEVQKVIHATESEGGQGMFVHKIDKVNGSFTAMKVVSTTGDDDKGVVAKTMVVGKTDFDPMSEKILGVTYPQRNEVVQSPVTILGDDSLLLKYLNPHLCVIVTQGTSEFVKQLSSKDGEGDDKSNGNEFYKALSVARSGSDTGSKKKPLGVTKPGEEVPQPLSSTDATSVPTLFINLVDTVSGKILHRVSHAHADHVDGRNVDVPIVISENWVIYAFPNSKSHRTEIGVLTLHEGMIHKHGITAFSSPKQELSFSSFVIPKPIVLSKTFGFAKPVTAIGVTNTKGGISSKNVLLATGIAGQVVRLDRKVLDPRRPTGELKTYEKEEGLMKYTPIIPVVSQWTTSYTHQVDLVSSIVSTAANLESQSLVLAYGGPDIFFTRLAPSKGFDLLPDSFNRGLLMVIVLGLLGVVHMVKRMSEKKMTKLCWS